MAHTTQSSFHICGFWYYVNWNSEGTIGIDQHGGTWYNRQSPISEGGLLAVAPQPKKPTGWISNDDLFLQDRESNHEYFQARSAGLK